CHLLQIIEYLGRVVSNIGSVAALAPNDIVQVIRPIVILIVLFCCLGEIVCQYFKFIQSNTSESPLCSLPPPYTRMFS
ncbi:hypothetical protein BT69DRAFT_1279260, partial [Atractiella rhizophila]